MTTVRSRMIHRTTIERDNGGIDNSIGAKNVPAWLPSTENQPCFLTTKTGREVIEDTAVIISELHLLLPLGTDITENDRLDGVTNRLGEPILSGYINILSVLPHHSHLEVLLERAS